MPSAYTFKHDRHIADAGNLRFFRGDKATVLICAEALKGCRQLCQITFNRKSGAVYAQFTYFKKKRGVVAKVRSIVNADLSSRVEFAETGFVASTLVKYSHPPDGKAHFSQDGRVVTKVWADSLPLNGPEGHLFEIHAYRLTEFEPLVAGKERKNRIYLPFATDEALDGVSVAVEWRRKAELMTAARARGSPIGPIDNIPRRTDGKLFKAALFGPTLACGLQDHLLAVNVHPLAPPPALTQASLIFFGGWKYPHEPISPGSVVEYLAFNYPVKGDAAFAQQLSTIDLGPSQG